MQTDDFPEGKLKEHIELFLDAKIGIVSDIEDLRWNINKGNIENIDLQLKNIRRELGYFLGVSTDLESYLYDNQQEISNKIKDEILKEKI